MHKIERTAAPQPLISAFYNTVSAIITIIPMHFPHLSIRSDICITAFSYQFALNYPSMVSAVVVAGGASRFNEATAYGKFKGLNNVDTAAW
jgi:hypothetical protein